MARVTLAFSVDDEKDADIIAWWEGLDNRSAAMRAAIRAYRNATGLTLGDVLNELSDLKRMIRAGVTVQANGANGANGNGGQDDEPLDPLAQEAQNALNALAGVGG